MIDDTLRAVQWSVGASGARVRFARHRGVETVVPADVDSETVGEDPSDVAGLDEQDRVATADDDAAALTADPGLTATLDSSSPPPVRSAS